MKGYAEVYLDAEGKAERRGITPKNRVGQLPAGKDRH
jgi:hypothetical protein